ncbi:SpoIIIAH-like family protein [Tissierella creatinini]|nr:SpoIIIAH-like family protein [Tissierella creatinini]TJX69092.1 SpoIIIAH-like family protein [Soehngenia saccharolytica]
MFKIKRPAIIGMLLILLVFTGYLNYQLTQQALLKASGDYQQHEKAQMENLGQEYMGAKEGDYIDIVDSKDINENVAEVISSNNEDLAEVMNTESTTSRDYFVEYRLSRDKLRAGAMDRLDEIVKNENTAEDVRTKAQEEIINIGNISEKELQIEGLVKSKGFDEAIVFITDEDIKVVVSANELKEQDVIKILDIVKSETSFNGDSIKIMKKQ